MDIFDKSKEAIGNHVGHATDEAMRKVVTKLIDAANVVGSVNAPQSAQGGKVLRAYQSGVRDANTGIPMRIPAFCFDKKTEMVIKPDGTSVTKIVELENDELIAEYQRGYNNEINAKYWKKVFILGGIGVAGILSVAFCLSYRADSRRREIKSQAV